MALIIRANSMLPSPYLEIRIIYMYLYSFIINKLNYILWKIYLHAPDLMVQKS
jgi:hypothetical protein